MDAQKRYQKDNESIEAAKKRELDLQKKQQASLRKENEGLEQQIAQYTSYGHRPGSGGTAGPGAAKRIQRARELETRKDLLTSLEQSAGLEESKSSDLQEKIAKMRSSIKTARRALGGVNHTKESNLLVEKQIKVLENRLDNALVKFNEALHVNKELREQIDNLRRERGVFDTIYKKLERELQEKKKEMAFIIEVSNIAYEERDNAQQELNQLKMYASKEMQSFEETFKELDELLEEDRKMKEAIKQRLAEQRTAKEAGKADEEKRKAGKMSPSSSQGASRGAGQSAGVGGGGANEMTPQNYEEAFNKIKAATNMTDIGLLVTKFLHSEDDNFSLFNYVNELNNEIEKLEDARNEIKSELDRLKGQAGGPGDSGRKQMLKHLQDKLHGEEGNSSRFAEMADKTSKLLEQVMVHVSQLFTTLECEESKIIEQQGTAGLSENTIQMYLAAIELKVDDYLLRWRRLNSTADRGPAFPFGQASAQLQVDPPTTSDDYNDGYSDEEERVLTREELLMKTNQKLAKVAAAGTDIRKGKKTGKKKTATMFPPA